MRLVKKIVKSILPHYRTVEPEQSQLETSLSDNQAYPDFCLKASTDMELFANFRKSENTAYRTILEHVSQEQGQLYLDDIRNIRKDLLDHIEKIKENDIYGNPDLFEYAGVGKICPTTLRYAKVLADLLNSFGSLDGLRIAEIGVGYGGQCRMNTSLSSPAEYTLVDLAPVLSLAKTFLDKYVLKSTVLYRTMDALSIENYDLVISNYAFTELRRDIQDVYLDKIILNSSRGYITYNEITPPEFKSYKKNELVRKIPNSHSIAEAPLFTPKNCIILWGDT